MSRYPEDYPPPPGSQPPGSQFPPAPDEVLGTQVERTETGSSSQYASRSVYYEGQDLVEAQQQVYDDPNRRRNAWRARIKGTIGFLLGLLEALLALRFFLRLAGANPFNDFVEFIYDVTGWFVAPFDTIFDDQTLTSGGTAEWSTLFAMVIYLLAGAAVLKIVDLVLAPIPTGAEVHTVTRRRRM
jgi:hypothetical protein